MKLLDVLVVNHDSEERYIELYQGDLTNMLPEEHVDILVVSAFPNDYSPIPRTLIGALDRKGVSVGELSRRKVLDLRNTFSCWLSPEITPTQPGLEFNQILCFEPLVRGKPTEVVGEIFQSLMPIVTTNSHLVDVAMPVVATGNQGVPLVDMFEPLLDAAVHWLALGLPVKHLKIVHYSEQKAYELKGAFSLLKKRYENLHLKPSPKFKYDAFISYSHEDLDEANLVMNMLVRQKNGLRVFLIEKT